LKKARSGAGYPGWCYPRTVDGTLVDVPDRETSTALPDDIHLAPVRFATWGGFIFVNLDNDGSLARLPRPAPRCSRRTMEQMA